MECSQEPAAVETLFALSTRGDCEAVRLFALQYPRVKLLAIVQNAADLYEQLDQPHRPQVLVVDLLLPGLDAVKLREKLRPRAQERPVSVVLSLPSYAQEHLNHYRLQFERGIVLVRPYRLQNLFAAVCAVANNKLDAKYYHAMRSCEDQLLQMAADPRMRGYPYTVSMVMHLLMANQSLPIGVLYTYIEQEYKTEYAAVVAAVSRLSRAMCKAASPAYLVLCDECGVAHGETIPNSALVHRLAQRLRYDLVL